MAIEETSEVATSANTAQLPSPHRFLPSRVFYGWYIVAAGFINQAFGSMLLQRSYGAYVVFLRDEFGWSKAALSGAFSLQQIESGLLGPAQGWLVDRFGPKASMRVGVFVFGLGFLAFSQVHSLVGFYVAYLMLALGSSLSGYFPFTVVIVNWFSRRRARALSTMQIGGAVGGLLIFVVAYALETFGWRTTAAISGIIVILVGLPMTELVRRRPEDHGIPVDGIAEPEPDLSPATSSSSNVSRSADYTTKEAMRTPAFWLVSLGHGSALLIVSAVNVHLVLHLTDDLGYSLGLASLVVSVVNLGQIGGTLIAGSIGDRFEKRMIAFYCMAFHTLGLLLVANAVNAVMVFAFAVMHGLAWGLRGPMMQAIRADYFGRSSFGQIMGMSSLVVTLGSIAGPIVAGVLADRTGSYAIGFDLLAVLAGMGSVFFLLAKRPSASPRDAEVREATG
jgi:sugar phosphate permease